MTKREQALTAARAQALSAMQALATAAEANEGGLLTEVQQASYDDLKAKVKAYDAQIADQRELAAAIVAAPAPVGSTAVPGFSVNHDRASDQPFATLGEQLIAVADHTRGVRTDPRLFGAVNSGGAAAGNGADGGFQIRNEFTTELLESSIEGSEILSQADTHEVGAGADGLEVVYLDETSRATGSRFGGVRVYRGAEAATADFHKPQLGRWEVKLEDMIGFASMTDRLLQDAPSMQNVFETGFREEFRFKAEDEMVRGNGAGQMLGILNAPCLVTITKETGQAADTIQSENIGKVWKAVHPRSRNSGAFYYNVELEDQFDQLQIAAGASNQLAFMPPGGLSGKPYATIKGRPLIPLEYASGAGDVGDFFFADWKRFKVITKGGLQSDNSIHVYFLTNQRAFRWITRINGAPKDKAAITPYKATDSSFKLSPFVALGAR